MTTLVICVGFGPCSRPAGPTHPRYCDRCQAARVEKLTGMIALLTEYGAGLVGYEALEFDGGRMAFHGGDKNGGPYDRRTRLYRAWKNGWDLEDLLDQQAKGWP
jgi:hypothetical protein